MAGLGRKIFTAGDVLTASDVQNYLMDQTVMNFAGTAARSSAIATPTEGMVTYLADTNAIEVYDGSAYVGVGGSSGLTLVKTQTIGTTVSSVTVTDAFSATYDNYLITIGGGVGSAVDGLSFRLGTNATNYYGAWTGTSATGTVGGNGANNAASCEVAGHCNTSNIFMNAFINSPFLTKNAMMFFGGARDMTSGYGSSYYELFDTTSYTSFSFFPIAGGTLTGGTIRVYGYKNS